VTELGPLHYWWETFSTSVYLINRLPSLVNPNESPFSLLFGKKPDYDALKSFGYVCYPCLKPYNQHKFQFHTTQCVLLGYNKSHKDYKCLNSHGRISSQDMWSLMRITFLSMMAFLTGKFIKNTV